MYPHRTAAFYKKRHQKLFEMLAHLLSLPDTLFWRGEWGQAFQAAPLRPPNLRIAEPKE